MVRDLSLVGPLTVTAERGSVGPGAHCASFPYRPGGGTGTAGYRPAGYLVAGGKTSR